MKKVLCLLTVAILAFSIFTGCQGDNGANKGSASEYTAEYTPPSSDWVKTEGMENTDYFFGHYTNSKTYANVNITKQVLQLDKNETMNDLIENYKRAFFEQYADEENGKLIMGELTDQKYGEYEYKRLDYNIEFGSMVTKYTVLFVSKGFYVFSINFGGLENAYDESAGDFEKFMDSFIIKEK